jgi:ubiquinone/menaquinone biosynthesis C-methylase UbiE
MAADYVAHVETSPYTALYEAPGLHALLPPLDGRHVLDAGCGTGRTSAHLADAGAEVVGFDASPEMLHRARERVPTASFLLADLAEPLPFDDQSFDVIVASLVIHYLEDWVSPLRELRRVLRPGGAFVLSTHHPAMDLELSSSGDYYATELVVDRWLVGDREYEVPFWRRPLSKMFQAFTDSGFLIDQLTEPQPLPECRHLFPEAWERLTQRPQFLFLRLTPV